MYLYGAGGHAKVIMDVLRENDIELSGIMICGNGWGTVFFQATSRVCLRC